MRENGAHEYHTPYNYEPGANPQEADVPDLTVLDSNTGITAQDGVLELDDDTLLAAQFNLATRLGPSATDFYFSYPGMNAPLDEAPPTTVTPTGTVVEYLEPGPLPGGLRSAEVIDAHEAPPDAGQPSLIRPYVHQGPPHIPHFK